MGFTSGHRHLGFVGSPLAWGWAAKPFVLSLLSFHAVVHDAGRNTTPCGTSPLVTRRQRAMSSLRASATIIVLRVLARKLLIALWRLVTRGEVPQGVVLRPAS